MIYYYYRDHALRHFKKVAYSLKQLDILSCVHVTKYVTIFLNYTHFFFLSFFSVMS